MSDYIHALSESVERIHVRYPNRYGLMLAGDLYTAKQMDKTKRHMALRLSKNRSGRFGGP